MSEFKKIVNIPALEASILEMEKVLESGRNFNMEAYIRDNRYTYVDPSQHTLDALKNNCNTSACVVGWCAMSSNEILKPALLDDKRISFHMYTRNTFFYQRHETIDSSLYDKIFMAVSMLLFSPYKVFKGFNSIEHYFCRVRMLLDNQDKFVERMLENINHKLLYSPETLYGILTEVQSQNINHTQK